MAERDAEVKKLIDLRAVHKRDVFEHGKQCFAALKQVVNGYADDWAAHARAVDPRLEIRFEDRGAYDCALVVAGDLLHFNMHSNVFKLQHDSPLWKSKYVKQNPDRAYCTIIQVYNFLADSFRYQRNEDMGYLIARIFVNSENHFFVEGHGKMGFGFQDFTKLKLSDDQLHEVVVSAVVESLNFELSAPAYTDLQFIQVTDAIRSYGQMGYRTGKRLGFVFGDASGSEEIQ